MNSRSYLLCTLAAALAGCQGAGQGDVVNRELRLLEDRVYELEGYIGDYQSILDSCQHENDSLRHELTGADSAGDLDPQRRGATPRSRTKKPTRSGNTPRSSSPSSLSPPAIEFGTGEPELPELPDPRNSPRRPPGLQNNQDPDAPPVEFQGSNTVLEPGVTLLPTGAILIESAQGSGPAETIVLNRRLTGGLDKDHQNGDEGLLLVLEPQNADGQVVKTIGPVSLMVIDPAASGASRQVARWDFASTEAAATWRKSLLGNGMHFDLPWPGKPPQSSQLVLHARLITPEGRKLLTSAEISVDPPGDDPSGPGAGWNRHGSTRTSRGGDGFEPRKSDRAAATASAWNLRTLEEGPGPVTAQTAAEAEADEVEVGEPIQSPGREAVKRPSWRPFR